MSLSFVPVMWILWAVLTTTLLILLLYRSNLTRYEEDQLFLDESFEHQHREQDEILKKVNRVQPMVRIVMVCTCLMTATVIGFYVWSALKQFYM